MTLLRSTAPATADAIRLLSAVGDVLGAHGLGFGMRLANVAARFAVHRGCEPEMVAATYFAAALHEIGLVRVMQPAGATPREAEIAGWDGPPHGARFVTTIPGLPHATSDYVRWHRESFDGMGFPDHLRWNGIPHAAMAINVARGFVAAIEAQGEFASPPEAMFAVVGETGRAYSPTVIHEFRDFYSTIGEGFDAAFDPAWPLDELDPFELVGRICEEIDAREERSTGRGNRLAATVLAIGTKLNAFDLDPEQAAFAARLTSLGRLGRSGSSDDFDPLARLGREARAVEAATAARLLQTTQTFAPYAAIVSATSEWFDGTGLPRRLSGAAIDPIARVLAVALAAEALSGSIYAMSANGYPEAPIRISAAAKTQFDPAVVAAYLSVVGGLS